VFDREFKLKRLKWTGHEVGIGKNKKSHTILENLKENNHLKDLNSDMRVIKINLRRPLPIQDNIKAE
jgi:hypothetical protein